MITSFGAGKLYRRSSSVAGGAEQTLFLCRCSSPQISARTLLSIAKLPETLLVKVVVTQNWILCRNGPRYAFAESASADEQMSLFTKSS